MQTNISIQSVLIPKLRLVSKLIIRLAKETDCAPEILHSYHTILSQRPHLEQSKSSVLHRIVHRPISSPCRYLRNSDHRLLFW